MAPTVDHRCAPFCALKPFPYGMGGEELLTRAAPTARADPVRHYDVDDPDGAVRVLAHDQAAVPRLARKGRTVPQASGTLYRGREGMWTWVAHRISGVLIFLFLFAHVLDTALVRVSPDAYNSIMHTYKTPIVGLGELGLVAAVIFHALNGIRVILVDFWSRGTRLQRQMGWAVVGLFVILFVPFAIRHLINVFA